jgi:uncharacterized membrane protein YdjX (TVP38/TMEM64 family)
MPLAGAVSGLGWLAGPAAVLLGAALLAILVPRTAISLGCGALFGAVAGFGWALGAAMLAAWATFGVGRWLGRERVAARAGARLAAIDSWLARRGLLAVAVVRMLPLAPFGLIGYAYGTTSVRREHYVLGTLTGAAPSAASYAAIGAAIVAPGQVRLISLLPGIIGMTLTASAAIYWRRHRLAAAPETDHGVATPPPRPSGPVPR